jgi:Elongation factor G, domain IV
MVWTVSREFDQPIRHMDLNRSAGSFVANMTLRIAPSLENPGVCFTNGVTDPEAVHYIQFVERGIGEFISTRAEEGRPVGHIRITLVAIAIHPVDAKGYRFAQAAQMALSRAFEAAGVEL